MKFDYIKPNILQIHNKGILDVDINKCNLLAIGETHGVKENVDLYFTIYNALNFECIALEFPVDTKQKIDLFLETGELNRSFFETIDDGRFNIEMLSMLKDLYEAGKLKKIICFDQWKAIKHWNDRDADYAEAFLKFYDPKLRTLIIGGGLHIKKGPFEVKWEKGMLIPMCHHIKNKLGDFPTLSIKYNGGEFFNFEKRSFNKIDNPEVNGEIFKTDEYLYEITLNDVHSIKVI